MRSRAIEPIATAIGPVEIALVVLDDLDDVLDILNEAARWLTSRGINQWIDGFPRELIARNISRGEVYLARRDRRAVGIFHASVPESTGRFPARQYEKSLS